MIETLHRAAQYLSAAANSYLPVSDDDSHANLEWSNEFLALTTRPLNGAGNLALSLNYPDFKLEWVEPGERIISDLELNGKTHGEVLSWLEESSSRAGLHGKFEFSFNYELRYDYGAEYTFSQPHPEEFVVFANNRSNAQKALEELFEDMEEVSEIRVWPDHFDTAGIITVEKKGDEILSRIGVGLAIPDGMVKDMYYYATAYPHGKEIDYSDLPGLRNGMWITDEWKGMVLPASNVSEEKALIFFKEAVMILQALMT